jgi:hypothetical protein
MAQTLLIKMKEENIPTKIGEMFVKYKPRENKK